MRIRVFYRQPLGYASIVKLMVRRNHGHRAGASGVMEPADFNHGGKLDSVIGPQSVLARHGHGVDEQRRG
jgi:hypothetical protein